ncbi:hypothetical protein [Shewanella khirikhana]|uniref:Lipoprotein n=1 Tax=Shewanella khirikhana TaxID=1965282 RepID=A0A3Q9E516_9GAMM|nr:hypothetical protein [Shewanella khirikhana]AZQ10944.1 hypothetical protein STH12_01844 [Shewanella khirikhana]
MLSRSLLLAIVTLSLGACSSSAPDTDEPDISYAGKIRDRLSTSIKDNGLKLFTYSVSASAPSAADALPPLPSRNLARSSRSRPSVDLTAWTEQIEIGLARTLAMSGYCREGSTEISRLIQADRAEIRGECNESASDEDRQRFGSKG